MDVIPSDNDEISPEESLLGRKGKRSRKNLREPKTVEKKSYKGYSALSPNLTAISKEFNMTAEERDRKLGRDLNTVYLLISAPVTFLITYAADKMNRKYLFAWNTLICQISGILTGCSTSYTQLFLCRGLGGITMGAAMPIMFSLLGDLFSNNSRSKASALASVVMGMGMLFGQVISGLMGQNYGWKSPFLLCSILGTIFSLCAFKMDPPPRGAQEDAVQQNNNDDNSNEVDYGGTMNLQTFYSIFKVPIFLQGIPGCIPWGVIYVYLPDYLVQETSLNMNQATIIVVLFGVGATLGSVLGGWMGQSVYNRNKVYLPIFMGIMTILGTPTMLILMKVNVNFSNLYNFLLFLLFYSGSISLVAFLVIWTAFAVNIAGTNLRAILLNVNLPETRSTVISISQFVNNIGRVLGPIVANWFLGWGRKIAFSITYYFWLLSGVLLIVSAFYLKSDEEAQQRKVADNLNHQRENV